MRSFQIVEDKIKETDFFLEKIKKSSFGQEFEGAPYYLSAFLSASRSITFALQASIKDIPDFEAWYEQRQDKLKKDDLAKYFVEIRNLSQKIGYYPICSGLSYIDENKKLRLKYFFDRCLDEVKNPVPEEDVLTACNKYFALLLELVCDCFKNFGHIIDPVQYFIYGITKAGRSLEDIEEKLGYPRGWTNIEDIPYEERVRILRQEFEKNISVDYIFEKHLGTNRFGEKI